ncbi:MAG: hypothetical protein ACQESE_01980 [Nanobdellota archaeon]
MSRKRFHKLSSLQINIIISIVSIILGALSGFLISDYYFQKNIEYQEFKEFQEIEDARPNISIDVRGDEYIAFIIKTPDNNEIIERLKIDFLIKGEVISMKPRLNIINGEPCELKKRPFLTVKGVVQYEKVIVTCEDVMPSTLNGVIVNYKQKQTGDFDKDINVMYYWDFRGQTQIERFEIERN